MNPMQKRTRQSLALACALTAASVWPVAAEAYTLNVKLFGLIGYANTPEEVWALLPDAQTTRPLGAVGDTLFDYPPHYAYLRVAGKNVKSFTAPEVLLVPLRGYDLQLPEAMFGRGEGLTPAEFYQPTQNGQAVAADKLGPGWLSGNPPPGLAARMRLPRLGLQLVMESTKQFGWVWPHAPLAGNCAANHEGPNDPPKSLPEGVEWTTTLKEDLVLRLRSFGNPSEDVELTIGPARGEQAVDLEVVNQVIEALQGNEVEEIHFEAYRWFYNLSAEAADCGQHYYPVLVDAGGKRCPPKLFQ